MKVRITIGERSFDVEVGDLRTRPVIVAVDGQPFEVWPEEPVLPHPGGAEAPDASRRERATPTAPGAAVQPSRKTVVAPLPGVVASIAVQPGSVTAAGQELCVLEAMKMKNAIRASRAGEIAAVHVSVGQHVRHNDLLMEYVD
jgi:biotin carboxyl carrier protein